MQLLILALLVITYVEGTFCQKITFDNTDVGGITVGRFYIDGTIGENVTELLQQKWQRIIFIEVKKINASTFSTMCELDVSGATCTPDPVDICQCFYNTTNVHFMVNGTASPDLYNAIIRAQWQHQQNPTTVYSNKNYTVPGSDDVTTTTTESSSSSPNITDVTTTTTESSSSSPNINVPSTKPQGDNIGLIVGLSVAGPLVGIAIVIAIVWYCKKKKERSQAVSNNGTGSTPKEEKPEQPKQQSEHTNQAYEGERRISPTSVTLDEATKANTNDNLPQHNSLNVNNSHVKDNTNGGSASQTVPGEPRQLPLPRQGQPRPPSVETTSHKL